jgi:hypothetical protein
MSCRESALVSPVPAPRTHNSNPHGNDGVASLPSFVLPANACEGPHQCEQRLLPGSPTLCKQAGGGEGSLLTLSPTTESKARGHDVVRASDRCAYG